MTCSSQTLEVLERLIAFPTIPDNSNRALIDYVEAYLRDRGFAVTRLPDDTGEKAGLVATLGPAGAGVLLSAHTDVVPVEGQEWTRAPFKLSRDQDRLYGRGTTDMKGYVASVLAVADRAAVADLKEPLKIVLSFDEEIGCVGIRQMIGDVAPLIGHPRACFVGEPTGMEVAVGHKGKAALRAICHGQAGHSALAPQFTNALHVATDFINALRGLQDDLARNGARDEAYGIPYSTVHVGKLSGGTALNIVPDHAKLLFEYRHLAADTPEEMRARIDACADAVRGEIEIEELNAYPGLDVPEAHDVVGFAQRMAHTNGITKVPFGTEAGFFDALGIPTVVCGPGSMEGQGHKPDEYIEMSQLAACDAMMDRILQEISQ
ncbi:acetylornithine deacetylase [Roseovarius sp. 2305UL8-3]|uniref:acetylornithine deacetylase n=1 Tax=Roseovarius conchicola TaxID=3121636 RepID=UPI003527796B